MPESPSITLDRRICYSLAAVETGCTSGHDYIAVTRNVYAREDEQAYLDELDAQALAETTPPDEVDGEWPEESDPYWDEEYVEEDVRNWGGASGGNWT